MIASRIVILAVVVLTAVAAADAFRGEPEERIVREERTTTHRLLGPRPEYVAAGEGMHTRIERLGREFLSEEQIDDAFPAPLEGLPFNIAHTAVAPRRDARAGRLQASADRTDPRGRRALAKREPRERFHCADRRLGGGLGFTADGRDVATVTPDGRTAVLFSREGERVGRIPVTSW